MTKTAKATTKDIRVRAFPIQEHNVLKSQAALEGKTLEEYITSILLTVATKKRSAA
jgi:hypothetical protein